MDTPRFEIFALTPADAAHPGLAASAAAASGVGVLDLEFCRDAELARRNFGLLLDAAENCIGLRLTIGSLELARRLLADPRVRELHLILAGTPAEQSRLHRELAPSPAHRVLAEITDADAVARLHFPHHGLIAKGHESGGWVGADTSYILLQKLLGRSPPSIPVYAQGGIGLNSAAACRALGAAGVVLDDQLWLLAESPLPQALQNELARLNGAETRLYGELLDAPCRIYARPAAAALKAAEEDHRLASTGELPMDEWRARLNQAIGWAPNGAGEDRLLPIGQGIGLARIYRDRYQSVAGLLKALRKTSFHNVETAARLDFLAPGGPLAAANGTRYPLAQGPMTRVSDNAEFAYQVAKHGALPFLALALMRGPQVRELLHATRAKMETEKLPWGVGQLGFVPQALREEQCAEIWNCKPTFALLAGGRPDQAAEYEKRGIPTYIHAPAPALLKMYLEQGAQRFVFEGRECGGHIGPLASFPLWEQMIEVLLAEVPKGKEGDYHLLFAGGISDAASGAMLAALAAPLASRGFKVGALMGTAYLFTREIVESGAIVPGFQDEALRCSRTVNLESGPGHSTRCADTPFAQDFYRERRKLLKENRPVEEIRDKLEDLNLGRLRVASKGRDRDASGQLIEVAAERQRAEGMYMIGQVATLHDAVRDLETLHRDVTAGAMARLRDQTRARAARIAAAKPSEIAIVGAATLLPGAGDAQRYWRNILDQVRVLREVPAERWDWKLYFDADRNARDKIYSRWGGFLEEVPFDPIAYGIPPKSMKSIDPMQLLTLEVARRALADAGLDDGDFDREHTSIILGAGGGLGDLGTQYAVRSELPRFVADPEAETWERLPEWSEESFAGSLLNVAAGRVANRMDFGGVNFIVDAACASSLAAVAMAINELESGRSNIVLAGGVDTVQSAFGFMSFSKTQALSPNGQPKTFDQSADGIAISEGLAIVVLKRLADAERDGDRIYAVIKACAGSSDGKALGMTAPRPEGQKRALRRAYAQAGFSPATLGLIEAHGTGTPVGDRAEAQTITETLSAEGAAPRSCAVGSVKTLIGHTKASAGVCGLIKAALALHHRTLPGHYGVTKPIEAIADERSPAYLLKEPQPWLKHPDHPRRAGVSAFGFGGTNFHAVLEEYQGQHAAPGAREWPWELFCFHAPDEKTLAVELGRLVTAIRQGGELNLRDLAYSLARAHEARSGDGASLAVVAKDRAGLLADLEAILARLEGRSDKPLPPSARLGRGEYRSAPVAFLFPGQGAQYVNMGREAALYLDELRSALEFADHGLRADFPQRLSQFILPPAAFDEATEQRQAEALRDTRVAQPAIGALSLGYLRLAERLGLSAAAAAGHSYGEYTALAAAGVLAPEDFLRLSAVRGRCMAEAARSNAPGAMAAVQARRETVAAAIAEFAGVKLANHNAPEQAVISGPAQGVEAAAKKLETAGVRVTRLPVSGAFHTELVAGAQLGLSAAIAAAPMHAPRFAVYSNASGKPYPVEPAAIRRTLDAHMLQAVEFVAELEAMHAAGCRVFVELGPKGVCTNLAKATLAGREFTAVALDGQGGGLRGLLLGLAELYAAGVELKLSRLFDRREPRLLDLGRLAELIKPLPLPKHAWWVSGGGARPLDDPQFRTGRLPPLDAAATAAARAKKPQTVPAHISTATPVAASAVTPVVPVTPPAALSSEALLAYQQTMRQFLQLQERVLMQFLGGGATSSAPAMQPLAMPTFAAPEAAMPAASQPPAPPSEHATLPVSATPSAVQAAPAFDARTTLLELVAERTGYPQEMLGLEQDLEAELGIDSIKRVEILGAFRKRLPPAAAEAMQAHMERYTRARTLAAILAQAESELAADTNPSSSAANPAASNATTPSATLERGALQAQLLELVAERTGYPQEMLGLEQDLEAELGIDSIKRVEILGGLRKRLPAPLAEAMQTHMERFTKARSLKAILDAALALAPASAPVAAAAAVTPTAAMLDSDNLRAQLLELVAERTGYPQEMLGLEQDLEAELGIDSIKRVEILGGLRKRLPAPLAEAMQTHMERFTKARSLKAILEAVIQLATAGVATSVVAPVAADAVPTISESRATGPGSVTVPRYVPRLRSAPLPARKLPLDGTYLLAPDTAGVAEKLADRIVGAGAQARVLPAAALENPELLAAEVARVGSTLRGVVHLAGLDRDDSAALATWKRQSQRQVKSLFRLMQLAAERLAQPGATLLAASRCGGSFGREAESASGAPQAGGALGLFNCALYEWPQLRARLVDFADDTDGDFIADALLDELLTDDGAREIGYARNAPEEAPRRVGFVHVPEPLVDHPFAPHLRADADWVVLVTGGARGITAEIAEELVRRAARPGLRLVLVGRTPPSEREDAATAALSDPAALKKALLGASTANGEKITPAELERRYRALLAERELRANLKRLAAAGAQVDYRVCDVRDAVAFETLIDALYAEYGRIDAAIHGAGVIEDKRIADKTADSFDRVYDTKVDSAWVLSRKLEPEGLKLLVFFTSVAGRFGNLGQADYGAANETLNRLAWQLHHRWPNTRVMAINWGPWHAGMAGEAIREALRARGIEAIPIAGGRRWFADELAYGSRNDVELVAGDGPWKHEATQAPDSTSAPVKATLIRGTPRVGAGGAVLLEQRVTLADLSWPPDRTADGRPTLPLAAARECLAQFVAAAWSEWQVGELRDVRAGAPLAFDEHGACTLVLRARAAAHNEPDRQAVTVELLDASSQQSAFRAQAILQPCAPKALTPARAANETR